MIGDTLSTSLSDFTMSAPSRRWALINRRSGKFSRRSFRTRDAARAFKTSSQRIFDTYNNKFVR